MYFAAEPQFYSSEHFPLSSGEGIPRQRTITEQCV
jgi:hypothetical protein